MPDSPDDSEQSRPARKSKRARRISTPHRISSITARLGAIDVDAAAYSPETWLAVEMLLRLPPPRMLAAVIKMVLRDRINDEELQLVCQLYHNAVMMKQVAENDGE
jgi:hypothetical protein